jgi:hypothetical protein
LSVPRESRKSAHSSLLLKILARMHILAGMADFYTGSSIEHVCESVIAARIFIKGVYVIPGLLCQALGCCKV